MVASDQDGPDAGGPGPFNGCARLRARRIDHANHTQKDEVALEFVGRTGRGCRGIAGDPMTGIQRPACAAPPSASASVTPRICARRSGVKRCVSLPGQFMGTTLQQHPWRALGKYDAATRRLGVLVQRAHSFAFRRKRRFRQTREPGLNGAKIVTRLCRGDEQRCLLSDLPECSRTRLVRSVGNCWRGQRPAAVDLFRSSSPPRALCRLPARSSPSGA